MPKLKLIEVIYGPLGEVTINHHLDYYPLVFIAGLGPNLEPQHITPGRVETVVEYLKLFNCATVKSQTFHEVYLEACIAETMFEENGRG